MNNSDLYVSNFRDIAFNLVYISDVDIIFVDTSLLGILMHLSWSDPVADRGSPLMENHKVL